MKIRTTLVSAENLLANLLEGEYTPPSHRDLRDISERLLVPAAVVILPIAFVQDRLGLLAAFGTAAPLLMGTYLVLAIGLTMGGSADDKKKAD